MDNNNNPRSKKMTKSDGRLHTPSKFRTHIMDARHYFAIGCVSDALDSVGDALGCAEPSEEFELASALYDTITGRS